MSVTSPASQPASRRREVLTAIAGGAIGVLVFAASLGLELADPRHVDWVMHGDWGTHFLGWHLYRAGPWTMPIGATPLLAHPIGSSVGLTDSIPLAAIALKPFDALLPADFQHLGAWLLLCFVLQGVFGVLLMRAATPRVMLQLLGATTLVLSPPLLFRLPHPALSSHWLILAALWLYFRKPFDALSRPRTMAWGALVAVTSAVHPYLLLMVLAVAVAAHLRQAWVAPARLAGVAARLAAFAAVAVLVLWQCGYFLVGQTADLQAPGLGFHSMNLLAPVLPMGRSGLGLAAGDIATPGQYEGYAYFGAGLLTMCAVAIVVQIARVRRWRIDAQHLPFLLACLALVVLALSPTLTIGARTIATYDERWWGPLTLFRSSGRLFWPVFYAIAFGALATVARRGYAPAIVLLSLSAALQAADTREHLRAARLHRSVGFNTPLTSPFWTAAPPHYERLTIVPTSLCTPDTAIDARPFLLLAGRAGLAVNAGASARVDAAGSGAYCAALAEDLRQGQIASDAIYVLSRDVAAAFRGAAGPALACTTENHVSVCFEADTAAAWRGDYDWLMAGWPAIPDVASFLGALDTTYREQLGRGPVEAPGTTADRARAILRYLAYRARGCRHDEARAHAIDEARDGHAPRTCETMSLAAGDLPPPIETYALRAQLAAADANPIFATRTPTHVDPLGEAVWVQEYARLRLHGATADAARDEVLRAVRSAR